VLLFATQYLSAKDARKWRLFSVLLLPTEEITVGRKSVSCKSALFPGVCFAIYYRTTVFLYIIIIIFILLIIRVIKIKFEIDEW
jgi:hypothetical protein